MIGTSLTKQQLQHSITTTVTNLIERHFKGHASRKLAVGNDEAQVSITSLEDDIDDIKSARVLLALPSPKADRATFVRLYDCNFSSSMHVSETTLGCIATAALASSSPQDFEPITLGTDQSFNDCNSI